MEKTQENKLGFTVIINKDRTGMVIDKMMFDWRDFVDCDTERVIEI